MPHKIAVLGYGSQGRAWALNLRDSGLDIIVGLPVRSKSRRTASKDGLKIVVPVSEAVKQADILIFAFPDHLHGPVFARDIEPHLKPGTTLVFLHGFSIHFKTIVPPKNCPVILLAPLGPGAAVREKYLAAESIGYFYGIGQDCKKTADTVLKLLFKGLHIDRQALIKTTFADEAIGDIFGEQAVLCGGLSQLIKNGYETLVEDGLSPEKAYLEVAYQIDLIVDLIKKYGIEGMFKRISVAARVGSVQSGGTIIGRDVKIRMKKLLAEIKRGDFARRLSALDNATLKKLDRDIKRMTVPSFEKAARKCSPAKSKK
ncbi:Ketol-acid reductoisomerase [Candidatus Zixiibacteriota bacterium]|nr:Ketol-acid reductoisomerase [candidate division Zixibacteria bacterium]